MNSLNILSARVIGSTPFQTHASDRPRRYSDGTLRKSDIYDNNSRSTSDHVKAAQVDTPGQEKTVYENAKINVAIDGADIPDVDEKIPFSIAVKNDGSITKKNAQHHKLRLATRRLMAALTNSLRWVLSALASPSVYIVAGFYDEKRKFSPLLPAKKLGRLLPKRNGRKSTAQAVGLSGSSSPLDQASNSVKDSRASRRKTPSKDFRPKTRPADPYTATSESEADGGERHLMPDIAQQNRPKLQTSSSSEDIPHTRRSVRIKLYNEDANRRRKQRKENTANSSSSQEPTLTVATIKSPTSPTSSLKLTTYPRAPAPPTPLIPRRQPSYSAPSNSRSTRFVQKTLVIDLDETLIHSLAKGGRMSSGHMVEVKLNATIGHGGATLGPQHPILYYVHKRPHCDDFLRKVCKWYNLVVFTASVQEYADPVIDWLEQERKYFSGRYYRQHCTFRNGAYIKDLSSVEPNLSQVIILDNSPLSYIFHEGIDS